MAWTDESKAKAIEAYTLEEPTPETSMEIVKMIADDMGESPNGVRMILTKANVYVKKSTTAATKTDGSTTSSPRVNKAAAQKQLTEALVDCGIETDEDIISKLTGKAAIYFALAIAKINE
ncbi:MAG TPA: hypothetical protein DCW83_04460 [Saprospirales bacterium]|nr:hypothetical protein [Saprospirales bacterium]